jgi:outer membrane biosynthesis protein TonB
VSPRRRLPGNVGLGVLGTAAVHGLVTVFFLASARGARTAPPTYRVRLIAAPELGQEQRKAPEAVAREAEPKAPPAPAHKPPPRSTVSKAAPPPVSDTRRREAAPRTTPKAQPLPGETPSTGSDVATVSTEGVEFPFPEYLQNIVSQILRRWQRPLQSTPLESEVSFFVHRDGSVTDLQFIKRSGNFAFDLEAQGAVEEAGRFKAFGTLPDGWRADVLFVRFYFSGKRQ